MRKWVTAVVAAVIIALVAIPAGANHDAGVDQAWSEPMNHETYWETYFAAEGRTAIECTKFEGHGGSIPAGYEAVVVHDGQWVRVYSAVGGATFTAAGPMNLNSPDPDDHFGGPHSWIMKCDWTVTTTTTPEEEDTTIPTTTTTTTPTTTSSSTTVQETTTTLGDTTTSSTLPATSSTVEASTTSTTISGGSVTTAPGSGELPFTGPFENVTLLAGSAVAMIALGWLLVKEFRRED